MDKSSFGAFQHQIRQNQEELTSYIQDLDSWKNDITKKDEKLRTGKAESKEKALPPVRNSLHRKKKVKKPKNPEKLKKKPTRIPGSDFRAWDKFDVDAELDRLEGEESNSSYSEETDEEWEEERLKQQALYEKDQGNHFFKNKQYEEAISCYTKGIQCDPTNAVLYSNRAMALLKIERYGAAEKDCTDSIALDPTYIKSYMRRATCREKLNKLETGLNDFKQVVKLEPENKMAASGVTKLEQELRLSSDGTVLPIKKSPAERSKAPLRRVPIEEIDSGAVTDKLKEAIAETKAKQGSETKRLENIDNQQFAKFTKNKEPKQTSKTLTKTAKLQENVPILSPADIGRAFTSPADIHVTKAPTSNQSPVPKLNLNEERPVVNGNSKPSWENESESNKTGNKTTPRSSQSSPRLTSYQFTKEWKTVSKDKDAAYLYLKMIEPSFYPSLFGESLETNILVQILQIYQEYFIRDKIDVYEHLLQLSKIKRFGMIIMLMMNKDKTVILEILRSLQSEHNYSDEKIQTLKDIYEL